MPNVKYTLEEVLKLHEENKGKVAIASKVPLNTIKDLTLAYTPGVAEPCKIINKEPEKVYDYTNKGNFVAVVSDGTAVLGLGDIGPEAGLPVMEGKAILFKMLAGVDAFPLCLNTKKVDEVVSAVKWLSPSYGGINLEDISAPRCFEIEDRLKKELDIPVFHDDQHGTAVVVYAAVKNAIRLVDKRVQDLRICISGAGAAGMAISKLLLCMGINHTICTPVKDIIVCDSKGILYEGREGMNPFKQDLVKYTNKEGRKGTLADGMKDADIFIGVSAGGIVTRGMVESMAEDAIVFAMANPVPEIMPEEAAAGGAAIVATGRSDYPNQINNVLGFPGIFRGALDCRASEINDEMKIAAANAIAGVVGDKLGREYIIPEPLDKRVAPIVAAAVAKTAMETGVARIKVDPNDVEANTIRLVEAAHRQVQ
ncbi:MAG: malic enzyme-like NAD(P)-binding protein [Candidatus Altiarchaeota archaeon]